MADKYYLPSSRPASAVELLTMDRMLKSPIEDVVTVEAAAPTSGALLIAGQEYSANYSGDGVICSGCPELIGDSFGYLLQDSLSAATSVSYVIGAKRILVPATALDAFAAGEVVHMVDATGLVSVTGGIGTRVAGIALGAIQVNPDGLPTGSYVEIWLKQ